MAMIYKPGKGWKNLTNGVYEKNNYRIHVSGELCRLPNNQYVRGSVYPESTILHKLIRINGGNRKRGTMAWANNLMGDI